MAASSIGSASTISSAALSLCGGTADLSLTSISRPVRRRRPNVTRTRLPGTNASVASADGREIVEEVPERRVESDAQDHSHDMVVHRSCG